MREIDRPSALSLREAILADAAIALSWTPEDDALRRWAGPSTRCPATAESLWADISGPEASTFAGVTAETGFVAFGQVRFREQAYGHLARLIVDPSRRGLGLGRALCLALMREAVHRHPIKAFSLYVYPDNHPAVALYRSLGYREQGMHPHHNCVLMVAPLSVPGVDRPGP
jgi:ribosomal protein S18 acetylase RimI-like enzyme